MIILRTGTPGACKTLSAVSALAQMLARFEKHPEEARPVFVDGVRDLALAHCEMPLKEVLVSGKKRMVPDWDAMPEGSYVIIDEAQRHFPARSSQAEPPEYVAWLNTHRHRGFDIEVITQHPKLLDPSLRALIGKHMHFRRLFGMQRSVVYEWDMCADGLQVRTANVTSYFPFPRDAFKWYKSAEVHTKQKFAVPKWVFVPVAGLALAAYAVPHLFSTFGTLTDKGRVEATIQGKKVASPASVPSGGAALAATQPAPSASASSVAQVASAPAPRMLGCMSFRGRSRCVDEAGRVVDDLPGGIESSREFGHLVQLALVAPSTASVPVVQREAVQSVQEPMGFDAGDIRGRAARDLVTRPPR